MKTIEQAITSGGPQCKSAILQRAGITPLVLNVSAAAALIGLSRNAAVPLFEQRRIPIIAIGATRRVVRVADLERLIENLADEAGQ